jgi:mannose-6-phosphate isomerase-like protein (cupin superfamily)
MTEAAVARRSPATSWFLDRVADSALRDGQVALVERSARAGQMPPLHVRDEDETYRVAAGRVLFFVGRDAVMAQAGDVVVAPAGVERSFRSETDDARWLVVTRVRSLPRYGDFGRAVSAPVEGGVWPSPDEAATLESIARANGIEVLGPPGVLPDAS